MNAVLDRAEVKTAPVVDKDWWRGAVIYQIYPRSFQDSNGDGIGDLLGIVQRLPYVASLGVDAIWISPFFTSPMRDFGYDVSDYCDVDPMFGSLADFDAVIETAHSLGIKVMIDLVLSHTSDQHPWFAESRADRTNPKNDWYVWADPKPDGTPPNNWLSIFGGSAWSWDAGRLQYYLHNFLTTQPDLNLHNSDVQDALLNVARFWMDRGVDGFRLDTINFYFADKLLRDNPPLAPELRNASIAPAVNPYNYQEHLYSKNQPENIDFLKRFRAVLNEYPGTTCVGEVGDAQYGLEILGEYTRGDDRVHMCYAFEFLSPEMLTAPRVVEVMEHVTRVAADGWACWAFSNHDVQRHASRWSLSPAASRGLATLMMCLRGSACIYQGEELGLHEADVSFEDLQDPYGIQFWPEFKGRDGCRTPMVWNADNLNGGFSDARPWLPVSSDHLRLAVADQEVHPDGLLHHYRKAIAFRHAHSALSKGALTDLHAVGPVLSFQRSDDRQKIFFALNMSNDPNPLTLPEAPAGVAPGSGQWLSIGTELNSAYSGAEPTSFLLGPWQPCIVLWHET